MKTKTKDKAPETCASCSAPISPSFGTAACLSCEQTKCVEFCIPGGQGTFCVDCEGDE